jgi:hypothetical protein
MSIGDDTVLPTNVSDEKAAIPPPDTIPVLDEIIV